MKIRSVFWTLIAAATVTAAEVPSPEVQIAGAVLAAPAELRDGAAVIGYDPQGARVRIREGKNEMICLASDPTKTAFNVACYHKDLEPFMARGRELLAQKVTGPKRNEIRFKEVEEGKIVMPREPRTLYVLTGTSFDAGTGKVQDPYLRWVIYVPFRHPTIHRIVDQGQRRRTVADVPGHGGSSHHDQPAQEMTSATMSRKFAPTCSRLPHANST